MDDITQVVDGRMNNEKEILRRRRWPRRRPVSLYLNKVQEQNNKKYGDVKINFKMEDLLEMIHSDLDSKGKLGMKTLEIGIEDIRSFKFNKSYQRNIEPRRMKIVRMNLIEGGYIWVNNFIVLNELREIIIGQHRVKNCEEMEKFKLPYVMVTFPNKESEAKFYWLMEHNNTKLNQRTSAHAKIMSGSPYFNLVDRLNRDRDSKLFGLIAFENSKSKAIREAQYSLSVVYMIVNCIAFGAYEGWRTDLEPYWNDLTLKYPYHEVRDKVNAFIQFIEDWIGAKSSSTKFAYVAKNIHVIMEFYRNLVSGNHLSTVVKYQAAIDKMKSFSIDVTYSSMVRQNRLDFLVNHFNIKKKINHLIIAPKKK